MSRTLDFSLPASHSGGKLTAFTYTRSLNELVGTWNAEAIGGNFALGATISISDVLTNGVITRVYTDSDGLTHLEGKDAGVWLMCTTPDNNYLATGDARDVITGLCSGCLPLVMNTDGLSGFNVRSVVSGSTRAEAILELALLSGCVAYINNSGQLVVAPPSNAAPDLANMLQDNGRDLDLDGYATRVTTVVTRRKESALDDPDRTWYSGSGSTPKYKGTWVGEDISLLSVSSETTGDTFTFTDATGISVTVTYSMTMKVPINVMSDLTVSVTRAGITNTTVETHDIETEIIVALENNQQIAYLAWCDKGHTITHTRMGSTFNIDEETTETVTRTFDTASDKKWAPEVFQNSIIIGELQKETREVVTQTRASQAPAANMPPYSPAFNEKTTREYKRLDWGRTAVCIETKVTNEARQVGTIDAVKAEDLFVTTSDNSYLSIPTHSTPKWVEVVSQHIYYEKYDEDGNCLASWDTETSDEGAAWLLAHIETLSDAQLQQWQVDYTKNLQTPPKVSVHHGSSSINTHTWQFMTVLGRRLTYVLVNDGSSGSDDTDVLNRNAWYENGAYKATLTECPHLQDGTCTLYGNITVVGDFDGSACPNANSWRSCVRAQAALEQACYEDPDIGGDTPMLEAPVVATATSTGAAVGYKREFYIDDIISSSEARNIAQSAANNILALKCRKGFTHSVTLPYTPSLVPNGTITEVAHDWQNLTTKITYRYDGGDIPAVLIPNSIAGVAGFVSDRDVGRRTRIASGTVLAINGSTVTVDIGGVSYPCSSKLRAIANGDTVSVSFSSGNYSRGQIVSKL